MIGLPIKLVHDDNEDLCLLSMMIMMMMMMMSPKLLLKTTENFNSSQSVLICVIARLVTAGANLCIYICVLQYKLYSKTSIAPTPVVSWSDIF